MCFRGRFVLIALALLFLLPSVGKAGQGGLITLVNGTPYNWRNTEQRSNRMVWWGFPDVITAGSTSTLYVEWSDSYRRSAQYGMVTFSLEGTGLSFQVHAAAPGGAFNLSAVLTNLSTIGNPQGSVINLGWKHNGFVNFILAGEIGSFTSSRPPNAWMHENLGVLGSRSLRHLCMPGSHNAGMSRFRTGTFGAAACNTVTQSKSVFQQLELGVRYFDIRPVISRGQFSTGHYTCGTQLDCMGGNGQSLSSVIDEVNAYTAANQELVVLYLSNDMNTDIGRNYPPLTEGEWCSLLSQLTRLNNRFVIPNRYGVDLTTLPLRDFIDRGAAVVVVVKPSNRNLSLDTLRCNFVPQGFYTPDNLPVYDVYSNTERVHVMQQDQLAKLQLQRPNPDAPFFLLSWTLTLQHWLDQANCTRSILRLAADAEPSLYQNVLPVTNRRTYPNVLYVDKVESRDVSALAMAVNSKASWDEPKGYVIYKGLDPDTGIYLAHTPTSNFVLGGGAWSLTRMNPAINTSATPAAVSFAGGLHVLYKGAWSDTRIYIAQPVGGNILSGGFWNTQPLNPAINTSTAPGVAVLNNTLYMLYKGAPGDSNVYIARSAGNPGDGNSWSANRLNSIIRTDTAPAVAAFNNALYMFYKGAAPLSGIYIARSTGDPFEGNNWRSSRLSQGIVTSDAPGVVVYRGALYVFYKDLFSTNIYVARTTGDPMDGTSWTYARLNPGINTTSAPKPVIIGDRLYLFYEGSGDNYIWIARPHGTDVFNGNAWQWEWLNNHRITTSIGPGAAGM